MTAAVCAGVGVATGAIPGSDGKISACYGKVGGILRVIDLEKGEKCSTLLEKPLSWNQAGGGAPTGPAGGDLTGTYPNPGVVSGIARDSEIFPTVLDNDGSGSTLDGDKLDGLDSTDFLRSNATAGGDLTGNYPNPALANGVVGTAQFKATIPAVRVTDGATVPDSTPFVVPFTFEEYDTADLHDASTDPSVLTVPVTGVYSITGIGRFAGNAAGIRQLTIERRLGGLFESAPVAFEAGESAGNMLNFATEMKLQAGTSVDLSVFQNSGATMHFSGFGLTMSWVAPG